MIQANTVITGDSLTVLRDMEADSVDMVITDPPYGIDYQSGRKEKASRLAKIANDKAPFIWWIYDAARVVKRGGGGGGYSVLPAGTFSRYSSTRCVSLA
jgi:site-specific DNA-methyltransferase (adenine-specific)